MGKFCLRKLQQTSLYRTEQSIFRYLEPFRRDATSVLYSQTDGRTNGRNDKRGYVAKSRTLLVTFSNNSNINNLWYNEYHLSFS